MRIGKYAKTTFWANKKVDLSSLEDKIKQKTKERRETALRIAIIVIFMMSVMMIYFYSDHQSIILHEMAHWQIFNFYGVESTMYVGTLFTGEGATVPNMQQFNERCTSENGCKQLQLENEVVGYAFMNLTHNLWGIMASVMIFILMLKALEFKKDEK